MNYKINLKVNLNRGQCFEGALKLNLKVKDLVDVFILSGEIKGRLQQLRGLKA